MSDEEIFAGVVGPALPVDVLPMGNGVTLSSTYAHVFTGYFIHFERLSPGALPSQLRGVDAATGVDIIAQIHIEPSAAALAPQLEVLHWLAGLLRLMVAPNIHVPVVSGIPFSEGLQRDTRFRPFELARRTVITVGPEVELRREKLEWVAKTWASGIRLYKENPRFNLAFRSLDDGANSGDPALYLLALWGGLEALFSPAQAELAFRVSSLLAVYLEKPGLGRLNLQKRVQKLYGVRSRIAHGTSSGSHDDLSASVIETYSLLGGALVKMLSTNAVPTHDELHEGLFGA